MKKHGYNTRANRHPLYNKWLSIKTRCVNKNRPSWKNYGGRGITLCKAWLNNPAAFIHWALANGWKSNLSIERKNSNKGYSPGNCTWIPMAKQQRNARRTKLTEEGVKMIRSLLKYGVSGRTIRVLFGISKQTVSAIKCGHIWKGV